MYVNIHSDSIPNWRTHEILKRGISAALEDLAEPLTVKVGFSPMDKAYQLTIVGCAVWYLYFFEEENPTVARIKREILETVGPKPDTPRAT
jgi:hypothetical protein